MLEPAQALTPVSSGMTPAELASVERFDPTPTRVRSVASIAVALASRFVMQGLNRVEVQGKQRFDEARSMQRAGRGLITFSNHVSLFDDPWLLACFSGPEWSRLRWVSADAHNFYGSPVKAVISGMGKAVPVVRGAGLDQPGMHFLAERLGAGDWVHIFPEGGRSREADGRLRLPLKTGMAHLVAQTRPLLLGFHHRGMQKVLPIGARLPCVGQQVTVRFGAVRATDDGLASSGIDAVTAWVQSELLDLERAAFAVS